MNLTKKEKALIESIIHNLVVIYTIGYYLFGQFIGVLCVVCFFWAYFTKDMPTMLLFIYLHILTKSKN